MKINIVLNTYVCSHTCATTNLSDPHRRDVSASLQGCEGREKREVKDIELKNITRGNENII